MTRDRSKHFGTEKGAFSKTKRLQGASPRPAALVKSSPIAREPSSVGRGLERLGPAEGTAFRRPGSQFLVFYGFHAVREALRAKRRKILDLHATEAAARRLEPEIAAAGLRPHIVTADDLARRLGANAVHQGVMLEALPLEPPELADIRPQSGIVLVLDQITDPHNAGAILRTAAAYGVDAVVMTERHAPEMAGVAAKAASGALEYVPIVRVVNLARALEELGEMGYLRLGLDSEAGTSLAKVPLRRPVALVLGGEGKGLRRLSRENCDVLVRLDMPGPIKSLNVSNACAVALTLLHAGLIV
ncbi:MAG TPA: 23S rRNA (guanosine(2251)-2'-O)-methyltransferase RlmB [Methylocella sp.]|nr:23S rRNA (guanosine(2251)-2'-O)-methyltransferase RlmB [Methylocella sp.]